MSLGSVPSVLLGHDEILITVGGETIRVTYAGGVDESRHDQRRVGLVITLPAKGTFVAGQ